MGLGARLALVFAIVAATTALLVGAASYVTTDRQVTSEIDQFLAQRAGEISDGQRDQPSERRDRDNNAQVVVAVSPDAEVQILDDNGDVVSNTGLLLPIDQRDVDLAESNGSAIIRTVTVDGSDYRMITDHLNGGGAVQVARSLDESSSLLSALRTRTLAITGVVALFAAGAGWIMAQRTTRPLRALTRAVDGVAETRDFSTVVPSSGRDEVGRLSAGFNRMLATLDHSQEQQHRLVQDAAHELRTPLTSVTANVDWLMRAPDLDSESRHNTLASVRRELGELNNLTAEIVELATDNREPPQMVQVDLAEIVEEAVQQFTERFDRHVAVETSSSPVMGDAESLAAVTNLLGNADKYSPSGGPIAVEVTDGSVFIDDAGPGIAVGEQDLVFERFYRRDQDRSQPGSGLGLSIVAEIVRQHHGRVSVAESKLGGARVGFTLPTS